MSDKRNEIRARWKKGIFLALLALMIGLPTTASAADSLNEALTKGKFSLNARMRYENVSHEAVAEAANAVTVRLRYGYATEEYKGFKVFIEGDFTRDLEPNNFNSTVNGKTAYPVVADPDSTRLNRVTVTYTGIKDTTVKVGRQRIKLDNDRFVGNVGFRQNEQTFDAVRVTNTSLKGVKLDYTYLWQVNRIFGSRSAGGKWDADTHLLNVSYDIDGVGKITAYSYLIDLFNAPGLSNKTFGARFKGTHKVNDGLTITYAAEYATQTDYARNPADFSLDYFMAAGGAGFQGFTARLSYEQLEGNGARGFVTPLATLHAFQGFTDNFLATPGSGITELTGYADYVFKNVGGIGNIKVAAWYRDFDAQVGSEDLGGEFDFLVAAKPWKDVSLSLKYAKFSGADLRPDVSKLWLTIGFSF
ncbi:MAG: alginate export family protein [Proteobacteria bacterium]|nr:alginate export family protein [Pseudomonadota bacterium]